MKSAARPSTRSRSKKKAASSPSISSVESSTAPAAAALEPADAEPLVAEPAPAGHAPRPIGEIEGVLSLVLGVLLIVSALFPRSIKQLLLLGLGGGLVYRGMTGNADLSRKLGIDN